MQALEKALLSFHTSKMADINAIVKELWQKTYRNSDIDYIQVRPATAEAWECCSHAQLVLEVLH
jgi:DNA repair protein RAD50